MKEMTCFGTSRSYHMAGSTDKGENPLYFSLFKSSFQFTKFEGTFPRRNH